MASGSQTKSGICADLPVTPSSMNSAIKKITSSKAIWKLPKSTTSPVPKALGRLAEDAQQIGIEAMVVAVERANVARQRIGFSAVLSVVPIVAMSSRGRDWPSSSSSAWACSRDAFDFRAVAVVRGFCHQRQSSCCSIMPLCSRQWTRYFASVLGSSPAL